MQIINANGGVMKKTRTYRGNMIEIKFRAFDKNAKIVHEVKSIDFIEKFVVVKTADEKLQETLKAGHHHCSSCDPEYDDILYFNEVELTQYTGFKDKNGNEVYYSDRYMDHFLNIEFIVDELTVANWLIDDDKCNNPMQHVEVIKNIVIN